MGQRSRSFHRLHHHHPAGEDPQKPQGHDPGDADGLVAAHRVLPPLPGAGVMGCRGVIGVDEQIQIRNDHESAPSRLDWAMKAWGSTTKRVCRPGRGKRASCGRGNGHWNRDAARRRQTSLQSPSSLDLPQTIPFRHDQPVEPNDLQAGNAASLRRRSFAAKRATTTGTISNGGAGTSAGGSPFTSTLSKLKSRVR